jgi:hypothetical protein
MEPLKEMGTLKSTWGIKGGQLASNADNLTTIYKATV